MFAKKACSSRLSIKEILSLKPDPNLVTLNTVFGQHDASVEYPLNNVPAKKPATRKRKQAEPRKTMPYSPASMELMENINIDGVVDSCLPPASDDEHIFKSEQEGSPESRDNNMGDTGIMEQKPCTCDICGKGFNAPSRLKRHLLTHLNEKPFVCNYCDRGFNDSSNLQKHLRSHTMPTGMKQDHKPDQLRENALVHSSDQKSYQCHICQDKFNSKTILEKHLRVHTREKPHTCDICGKGFMFESAFTKHYLSHATCKLFTCNLCGKGFTGKYNLQLHSRIHSGDKPYKCDVCEKSFVLPSGLQIHYRIHTGEKPYKCDICGKEFRQTGNLQTHRRVHTGEKPYSCDICGKHFSVSSSLRRHRRIHN